MLGYSFKSDCNQVSIQRRNDGLFMSPHLSTFFLGGKLLYKRISRARGLIEGAHQHDP